MGVNTVINRMHSRAEKAEFELAKAREALITIRKFASAIECGEEPWREGAQEITRMALNALAAKPEYYCTFCDVQFSGYRCPSCRSATHTRDRIPLAAKPEDKP